MNDYHYTTNCGQYVLMDGDDCLCGPYDEISICFDKESGTLQKHGSPSDVEAWRKKAADKLLAAGFDEMAANLICVTGRFPLEELNKCLSNSMYINLFYRKLLAGKVDKLPFDYGEPPNLQ